jgi:hypothetical protein
MVRLEIVVMRLRLQNSRFFTISDQENKVTSHHYLQTFDTFALSAKDGTGFLMMFTIPLWILVSEQEEFPIHQTHFRTKC